MCVRSPVLQGPPYLGLTVGCRWEGDGRHLLALCTPPLGLACILDAYMGKGCSTFSSPVCSGGLDASCQFLLPPWKDRMKLGSMVGRGET